MIDRLPDTPEVYSELQAALAHDLMVNTTLLPAKALVLAVVTSR